MIPPRHIAAAAVLLALTTAVVVAMRLPAEEPPNSAAPLHQITTTSESPDFSVLVESGASSALPTAELELTEEALARMSTTSSSTTTTIAETTSSTEAGTKTSPKTTSPPTTDAPPSPPKAKVEPGYSAEAESQFASSINSYRSSKGLGSLSRDGALDSYARSWAKKMAGRGDISHSEIGSLLPPWTSVGENVGVGGTAGAIFDALVGSSGHRANMLGDFTHFGIGVWRDASGVLWTSHVFAR